MSVPNIDLDVVQRWMMSVITHPSGVEAGITSDQARSEIDIVPEEIESVIPRSLACTSMERLAVYGNAYYSRLIECMASEFPAVRHAVGEESFGAFVYGYLQEYPSSTYTLNQLGKKFPEYLDQTRPPREDDDTEPDWPDFLVDLATLERIYSEVFDGPGEENLPLLTADALQRLPPEQWGSMRLVTSESLRLIRFRFAVQEFITAVRKEESPDFPVPQATWLVVNRRNFVVRRQALEETQWRLLLGLQQQLSLGEAIESAMTSTQRPFEELISELGNWFRGWTAAGYFRGLENSEGSGTVTSD